MEPQTYRYGPVWSAIGWTSLALAVAFPLLMASNHERIDGPTVLMIVAFAVAGAWALLYFGKYAVTIEADGFTVSRLGRQPFAVTWRQVRSVRLADSALTLETTDRRRISVSTYFSGFRALEDAAARNLPDVAYGAPGLRPAIEPELSGEDLRLQHLAVRGSWLRMARRAGAMAGVCLIAAAVADAVRDHLGVSKLLFLPRVLLVFVSGIGYPMGVVLAVVALSYLAMARQETVRARRVPPAA